MAGLALSGCISLLPRERPVPLYSFEGPPLSVSAPPSPQALHPVTVRASLNGFERAASGDRLLTVDGDAQAFISNARWVSPAQSLFESALVTRFAAAHGRVRLLGRNEAAASDARLEFEVTRFETRYAADRSLPPQVLVEIQASLTPTTPGGTRRDRTFSVRVPASANRVRAIVAAYVRATDQALEALVAWTNAGV